MPENTKPATSRLTYACVTRNGTAVHATRSGNYTLCGRPVGKMAPEYGEATCYRCRNRRRIV